MKTDKRVKWQERYEKEFGWSENYTLDDKQIEFITNLLTQHHQDLIDEIVEKLEWLKKNCELCASGGRHYDCPYAHFDKALTEAQTIIKSLNNE